jgi:hypothetical protein
MCGIARTIPDIFRRMPGVFIEELSEFAAGFFKGIFANY